MRNGALELSVLQSKSSTIVIINAGGGGARKSCRSVKDVRLRNMSGGGNQGRYSQKWERLPAALNRVTGAGIAESDAKQDICNAIADREIQIQLALLKHTTQNRTAFGDILVGEDLNIPRPLNPQDMDFENSRPLKAWVVKRERIPHLAGDWHIDWIEVASADVTKHLIHAGKGNEPVAAKGVQERSPRPRRKSQPASEGARRAIAALYDDGIPDQATEPNARLCKRVAAKLKELGLPQVSDDTILRAAGRRK